MTAIPPPCTSTVERRRDRALRIHVAGMLLVMLLCLGFAGAATAQQSRVALVVGVGGYKAVPALRNPPRDARAVAAKLRALGFDVDLIIDPDRPGLERAIRGLGAKARNADVALVFYAGHAMEFGGQNYLVPATADLRTVRDVPFETVPLDLIPAQLEGGAHVVMLFVDACRDNPFRLRIGSTDRGVASRGLAATNANATGTLIVYATAPGQTAEDGAGDDSPFTTALLRHIDAPGLEVRQMLSRVRRDVRTATNGTQIPWESSSLEGDFYFRPGAPAPAVAAPRPAVQDAPRATAPQQPAVAAPAPGGPPPVPTIQQALAAPRPPSGAAVPAPSPQVAARPGTSLCSVPPFKGMTAYALGTVAYMTVVNTGARCGTRLTRGNNVPFDGLTLKSEPAHGSVVLESSAFYYTPAPGYAGKDEFSIVARPLGSVRVFVTVAPAAAP
ncbi:MAG: caspase family protein [Proteobacteria bacterium]|nr:caspase family protein [Pseudomonadota bacterium]